MAHLAVLVLWREGREIPGVHDMPAKLYLCDVLHLGELLMLTQ